MLGDQERLEDCGGHARGVYKGVREITKELGDWRAPGEDSIQAALKGSKQTWNSKGA